MIWVKKESDVINLILKLISKIEECLRASMDTIQHYLKAEIDEAKEMAKKTDHLEAETDEIRREVEGLLFSGAFLPSLRGDVHMLVEAMDKIADSAEACCDFAMGQRPEVPEDFKSDFHKVTVDSIYSYDPLKEAAENLFSEGKKDVSIIREKIRDVGIRESDEDDRDAHCPYGCLLSRYFDTIASHYDSYIHPGRGAGFRLPGNRWGSGGSGRCKGCQDRE